MEIKKTEFREWVKMHTNYTDRTISNIVSRTSRANKYLPITMEETYLFYLQRNDEYKLLNTVVRSQIKKAVELYLEFLSDVSVV